MPTYEYVCRQCGEHLEVVQSFRDDPLTVCPGCEGELRKVFSAAGIIFKGSGWHIKDYASDRGGATKSAQGGEDASSSSEAGGGSEKTASDGDSTGSAATGDTKGSGSNASGSKGSDTSSSGSKDSGSSKGSGSSTGGDTAASA